MHFQFTAADPHRISGSVVSKLAERASSRREDYAAGMGDASRTLYLVCYDVACPRRLYRVHKFLLAYKVGGQKSFYECWLTLAELRMVTTTLSELVEPADDRVHIFQLDPRLRCEGMGRAREVRTDVFLIL